MSALLRSFEAFVPVIDSGLARHVFDPTAALRRRSPDEFIDKVAKTRIDGFLPGLGHVSGMEVVLLESLYTNLDIQPNEYGHSQSGIVLPISSDRQVEIADYVDTDATRTAVAITEVAEELRSEHTERGVEGELESSLVFGSMVTAATAHYGVYRRSGRIYYEHPREMSLILEDAWQVIYGRGISPQLERVTAKALNHDVSETTLSPKLYRAKGSQGQYLFARRHPLLPKTIEKQALLAGETEREAREHARDNLALTRTTDAFGNKAKYREIYIADGLNIGGEDFGIVKWTDIHHNLHLEPDPLGRPLLPLSKARKKARQYNDARRIIAHDMPQWLELFKRIDDTYQQRIDARKRLWAPFNPQRAAQMVLARLGNEFE